MGNSAHSCCAERQGRQTPRRTAATSASLSAAQPAVHACRGACLVAPRPRADKVGRAMIFPGCWSNRQLPSYRPVARLAIEQLVVMGHENRDVLFSLGDGLEPAQLRHHLRHVLLHPRCGLALDLHDVVHDPGGVDAVQDLRPDCRRMKTICESGLWPGERINTTPGATG